MYGIDFVVTDNRSADSGRKLQVSLLEVNSEPAIELTGPRLTWILEDLFKGIAKTCVEPFFASESSPVCGGLDGWKVGEARENMRKCLEVQVRDW